MHCIYLHSPTQVLEPWGALGTYLQTDVSYRNFSTSYSENSTNLEGLT